MRLLAIDPGPERSAYVEYDTDVRLPLGWLKADNLVVLGVIDALAPHALAVEMVASYGMAVGAEVFETCVWIGRYIERWGVGIPARLVYRLEVKKHICKTGQNVKDANIRQALIDRYGGKERAVGMKTSPGPLYGMAGDCWSALAVAITAAETSAET